LDEQVLSIDFDAEGLPVDVVPAVAVDVVGRSLTSMSTAHLENREVFSIDYESQSWEFLLAAPPLLHGVAQMHRGDGFIDDAEFLFTPKRSTVFWTWNTIPGTGGRAATIVWIVCCDCSHD
jgi:hypothetical protein